MTKEVMISKIYEKIADKTLSFGCRIKNLLFENKRQIWIVREVVTLGMFIKKYVSVYAIPEQCKNDGNQEYIEFENIEIIGHPVMIGDVLDYIPDVKLYNKTEYVICDVGYGPEKPIKLDNIPGDFTEWASYSEPINNLELLNGLWEYKRKPIEEQSEDCIEYIYNLIK